MAGERIITPGGRQGVLWTGKRGILGPSGICEPCCVGPCGESSLERSAGSPWLWMTETFEVSTGRADFLPRELCGGPGEAYGPSAATIRLSCPDGDVHVSIVADGAETPGPTSGGLQTAMIIRDSGVGVVAAADRPLDDDFVVCGGAQPVVWVGGINSYSVVVPAGSTRFFLVEWHFEFPFGPGSIGAFADATFEFSNV